MQCIIRMIHFLLLCIAEYHPDARYHPDDTYQYVVIESVSSGLYIASDGKLLIPVNSIDWKWHWRHESDISITKIGANLPSNAISLELSKTMLFHYVSVTVKHPVERFTWSHYSLDPEDWNLFGCNYRLRSLRPYRCCKTYPFPKKKMENLDLQFKKSNW